MVCDTSEFKTRIFLSMENVDLALILIWLGFIIQFGVFFPFKNEFLYLIVIPQSSILMVRGYNDFTHLSTSIHAWPLLTHTQNLCQ